MAYKYVFSNDITKITNEFDTIDEVALNIASDALFDKDEFDLIIAKNNKIIVNYIKFNDVIDKIVTSLTEEYDEFDEDIATSSVLEDEKFETIFEYIKELITKAEIKIEAKEPKYVIEGRGEYSNQVVFRKLGTDETITIDCCPDIELYYNRRPDIELYYKDYPYCRYDLIDYNSWEIIESFNSTKIFSKNDIDIFKQAYGYKLWFDFTNNDQYLVDIEKIGSVYRFYFGTKKQFEESWGDDWDDAPYEYNAGPVYDDYVAWCWDYLPKNNVDIKFIEGYLGLFNSPITKKDFKQGIVPHVIVTYKDQPFPIFHGMAKQSIMEHIFEIEKD